MDRSTLNDAALWQQVKRGDTASFSCLFERYWDEMFSMAYRRLADEATAKDFVQNIFIHAWENRQQITVEDKLSPYLFTALKYSVIRHIYREAKQGTTDLPLSVYSLPDEAEQRKQDHYEFDALREKVRWEIASMPDKMREVFILSYEKELSVREIALRLSISEQTVKNQVHNALKRLRLRLQGQSVYLPFIL
ncbi:sigma-70 family RNA polymerase sigma factor [Chitinophaga oryzae]|uniref:Sigma-70 family RNA polymerase sigma factor n=1 Tax=Chitinophaga oryzae TaxID=2725414 RepID=A0AAE6ZIA3_9BACT|nr:sigma-70 family RNA polymerase sigma factor [Chitinophaga oryzae]QJB33669.1 sigma-70 family RNA polymerase sigma factor [Chitinophaga oryzae]QJB40195.1 sigma-70 family RNA polymerase sigma factor [Chitinophaga oryzae]